MSKNPFKLEDHYDESFALEDEDEEEESLQSDLQEPVVPTQRPASARHGARGRPVSGRFRQPVKQTEYNDSESELESTEDDDEFNIDRPSAPNMQQNIQNTNSRYKTPAQNKINSPFPSDESSFNNNNLQKPPVGPNPPTSSENSDSDSENSNPSENSDDDSENLYDPSQYKNLPVSKEIKELFTHIQRYKPKKTPLLQKLRPFIPEYVPAVGDIDAFLKIPRPDGRDQEFGLGWQVLDEPSLKQTDPAILDQTLKTLGGDANNGGLSFVHSVENAEKNGKRVESWIDEITQLKNSGKNVGKT